MLRTLTHVVTHHPRRILIVATVATIAAGAFGGKVADGLAPYGADDPASQSVRADKAYHAATGRQPSLDVLAIVKLNAGVQAADSRARVQRVATELQHHPLVKQVDTFYDTHNKQMVSKDGRLTWVGAYFRPSSDTTR